MRLVIDDGYTLPFETKESLEDTITGRPVAEGLPVVKGRYRPALFEENEEFQHKLSRAADGKQSALIVAEMIASHVAEWDVTVRPGSTEVPALVSPAMVLKMPAPVVRQLLDVVITWAPRQQEKAAGNSPPASGSPS
jgi:hypothetical protein